MELSLGKPEKRPSGVLQIFNPVRSENWGVGFAIDHADAFGWKEAAAQKAGWTRVPHRFGDADPTEIWLTIAPSLLVVAIGQVMVELDARTQVPYWQVDKSVLATLQRRPKRRAIVMPVGIDGTFLCDRPVRLTTSGIASVELYEQISEFEAFLKAEYLERQWISKGEAVSDYGRAIAVFSPKFEVQPRGKQGSTSPVTVATGFDRTLRVIEDKAQRISIEKWAIEYEKFESEPFVPPAPTPEAEVSSPLGEGDFYEGADFDEPPY
jgi:hypothetical protein